MFKKIAIVVVVLLAAVLGIAMTKPDSFNVRRTANIKAPPEKIFPLIIDLHSWSSWSPWEKLDPTMKRAYSGSATGLGPSMSGKGAERSARGAWRLWTLLLLPR